MGCCTELVCSSVRHLCVVSGLGASELSAVYWELLMCSSKSAWAVVLSIILRLPRADTNSPEVDVVGAVDVESTVS